MTIIITTIAFIFLLWNFIKENKELKNEIKKLNSIVPTKNEDIHLCESNIIELEKELLNLAEENNWNNNKNHIPEKPKDLKCNESEMLGYDLSTKQWLCNEH